MKSSLVFQLDVISFSISGLQFFIWFSLGIYIDIGRDLKECWLDVIWERS